MYILENHTVNDATVFSQPVLLPRLLVAKYLNWETQRVLNDLKRTRLSRRRTIWLLRHPLLSCKPVLSFSVFLWVAAYWWEKGEEPNHMMARKSCPLFNIQYSLEKWLFIDMQQYYRDHNLIIAQIRNHYEPKRNCKTYITINNQYVFSYALCYCPNILKIS